MHVRTMHYIMHLASIIASVWKLMLVDKSNISGRCCCCCIECHCDSVGEFGLPPTPSAQTQTFYQHCVRVPKAIWLDFDLDLIEMSLRINSCVSLIVRTIVEQYSHNFCTCICCITDYSYNAHQSSQKV